MKHEARPSFESEKRSNNGGGFKGKQKAQNSGLVVVLWLKFKHLKNNNNCNDNL